MAEEKSGLDMIKEILQRLDRIEKQLVIQDKNIKRVMNTTKVADMINKAADTSLDDWARANKDSSDQPSNDKMRFSFESSDAAKVKGGNTPKAPKTRRRATATAAEPPGNKKSIMCKGKMLVEDENGKQVPLAGLSVKIYDAGDNLMKSTKTNRAGHWMSQFPPGKYVVSYEGEFRGQKLVPVNKNFTVPEKLPKGQNFIEVI